MPTATSVIAKTKEQLETELYTKTVKPAVSEYVETHRTVTWKVVGITQQAKLDGFTDEVIRSQFSKALLEVVREKETMEYKTTQAVINRAVRLGLAFTAEEIARKRKDKSFQEICADLAIVKEVKDGEKDKAQAFVNDLKEAAADGDETSKKHLESIMKSSARVAANKKKRENQGESGWTDSKVSGRRKADRDDWMEESYAIIDDQFDRFLSMIKNALEFEKLPPAKLKQLKELLGS